MQPDQNQSADDLYKQAQNCIKQQDFDQALAYLEQSLAIEQTANALHDKGVIFYMRRDLGKAIEALQAATVIDPEYHQAYANLTTIMFEKGEVALALEYCILAIQAAPDNHRYKDSLMQILRGMDFKVFVPELMPQILMCLKTDNIDHEAVARAWFSLLLLDPAFKPVYKLAKHKDYAAFEKALLGLKSTEPLHDEYFLMGLKRLTIADLQFEHFLTNLRQALLKNQSQHNLALVAALAEYCFQTEYIFNITAEEEKEVERLRAGIEDGSLSVPYEIAILGCYMPLCQLSNAKEIADNTDSLDDVMYRQILEPMEEEKFKKSIPSITGVDDETSQEVRKQYERFPYPRWRTMGFNYMPEIEFEGSLDKILIAGCGTGKEALAIARTFPKSDILAIDISMTSIAYAMRKAKELQIGNVTFKHADILGLGVLDEKFDMITSSGVLHHMQDPIAGWTVLMGLLKPRGYMHIGLYSKSARAYVSKARGIIKEQGYSNSAEDIRRFRADCEDKFDKDLLPNLLAFKDFFSLSDCRDLLFHVMEHQFELRQIEAHLEEFGLEPLNFVLPGPVKEKYRQAYPDDPSIKSIDNLFAFEKDHPRAFAAMYDFWSRKK